MPFFKRMDSRYEGKCWACGEPYNVGDPIVWNTEDRVAMCVPCGEYAEEMFKRPDSQLHEKIKKAAKRAALLIANLVVREGDSHSVHPDFDLHVRIVMNDHIVDHSLIYPPNRKPYKEKKKKVPVPPNRRSKKKETVW